MNNLHQAFIEQKYNARRRKIAWRLTFEQWLAIWEASGHLAQRGRKSGCYVMARNRDRGAYAVGNVAIIAVSKNNSDAHARRKQSKQQRENTARIVKAQWDAMTTEQRAERGRAVSESARRSAWENPLMRSHQSRGLKRMWASLTPEQRAARGRAISEGKRGHHGI